MSTCAEELRKKLVSFDPDGTSHGKTYNYYDYYNYYQSDDCYNSADNCILYTSIAGTDAEGRHSQEHYEIIHYAVLQSQRR